MYECKYFLPNFIYLVLLVPLAWGIFILANVKSPYVANRSRMITWGVVSVAAAMFLILILVFDYCDKYTNVYKKYQNGEYEQVTGEVYNFQPRTIDGSGDDSFWVQDIEFADMPSPGYHRPACFGGMIRQNGLTVDIRYIEYKNQRYIMRLEILD